MTKKINVKSDFSTDPYGRDPRDGPDNGQRFREDFIMPALNDFEYVIVDFEDVLCGPSFIEETFGGIIRRGYMNKKELLAKVTFKHELKSYLEDYKYVVDNAAYGIERDIPLIESE